MANTPQQRKRVRIAARQRLENLRYKSSIKTHFRRLKDSVTAGDADTAAETAKKHAANIYQKLGVHGRRAAVIAGRKLGLLPQR